MRGWRYAGVLDLAGSAQEARPVEAGARIRLAPGCDFAVRGTVAQGQRPAQRARHARERLVLGRLERRRVGTLELDAYGKVVAARPAAPRGLTGVPGTPV